MKQSILLLVISFHSFLTGAQVSNQVPVKVKADTMPRIAPGVTKAISPEPYETNYQTGIKNAKSSSVRAIVLKTFVDGLINSSVAQQDKILLLKEKITHFVDIDFYALYEYYMLAAKEKEKFMFFYPVLKSTVTERQLNAFTEYMKYKVASAEVKVYNQTTSVTEQLKKPSGWPADLPLPGYGWGKTESTDGVANPLAMQYHLTDKQRYEIIKQDLAKGKTVAAEDISWSIKYESSLTTTKTTINTVTNNKANTPNIIYNDETALKMLIGKRYNYENALPLSKTSCQVTGYKNKDEIYITCQNGDKRTVTYDELVNNKAIFGYKVNNTVYTCKVCKGNGTVKSTFSHTNDYEYTLGKKTTYTTTTTSKCNACGGTGYTYQ